MNLVIFSCSPRPENKSNTAAIVKAFSNGFSSLNGNSVVVYPICKRKEWPIYRRAFEENTEIIFAMPLFVECVPGILLEFLESLKAKENEGKRTRIGFILQSGFEEACQLRTAEHYLEKLPHYLNCDYAGTLLKGGMFALAMSSDAKKEKILRPFGDMGKLYAAEHFFEKSIVSKFASPEKYSRPLIFIAKISKPISKVAWMFLARKLGVTGKLDAQPYDV